MRSEDLSNAIYVGRRWYREESGLTSQLLSEQPYPGVDAYTEIHTAKDIEDCCFGPQDGEGPRPPGAKSWNGPCLWRHLNTAFLDFVRRTGFVNLDIVFPGFLDDHGGTLVVGFRIAQLPSSLLEIRDWRTSNQRRMIFDMTAQSVASALDWPEQSVAFHSMLFGMKRCITAVLSTSEFGGLSINVGFCIAHKLENFRKSRWDLRRPHCNVTKAEMRHWDTCYRIRRYY